MWKFSLFKKRGFTLIELLVVVAIIGILASIIFVNVSKVRQKAKRAAAFQSFQQITQAMYMYYEGGLEEGYWYGPSNPPPFVPVTYPNWNATYYCNNCEYALDVWDNNGDGKAGCSYVIIYNPSWTIYIYKYIICEDCSWDCNNYGYWPL